MSPPLWARLRARLRKHLREKRLDSSGAASAMSSGAFRALSVGEAWQGSSSSDTEYEFEPSGEHPGAEEASTRAASVCMICLQRVCM